MFTLRRFTPTLDPCMTSPVLEASSNQTWPDLRLQSMSPGLSFPLLLPVDINNSFTLIFFFYDKLKRMSQTSEAVLKKMFLLIWDMFLSFNFYLTTIFLKVWKEQLWLPWINVWKRVHSTLYFILKCFHIYNEFFKSIKYKITGKTIKRKKWGVTVNNVWEFMNTFPLVFNSTTTIDQ